MAEYYPLVEEPPIPPEEDLRKRLGITAYQPRPNAIQSTWPMAGAPAAPRPMPRDRVAVPVPTEEELDIPPAAPQQAQSAALRGQNYAPDDPALEAGFKSLASIPTQGPQAERTPQATRTRTSQSSTTPPQAVSRDRVYEAMLKAQEEMKLPDMTQAVEGYRQRYKAAGPDIGLAWMLSETGGDFGKELGGQVLKQAMAQRAPQKTDYGVIDQTGFTADPMKEREFKIARAEKQVQLLETIAHNAATEQERTRASQAAEDLRRQIADSKADAGPKLHLQRAGTTPSGELVTFNPATGEQSVNGKPYNGPVMSQTALDKQAHVVQESLSANSRLQNINALVAKNPNAFGGVATISQLTPQIISSRWQSARLTPEERQVRALVMQEAAQVINDLYGAAVSVHEQARANNFVPTNLDDPATVMAKLNAAMAWARSKSETYGRQVRGVAESRMGGGGGDEPPPGAVRPRNAPPTPARRATDDAPDEPPPGAVRAR